MSNTGPILLGFRVDDESGELDEGSDSWRGLARHKDEDQVKLDVDRSFVYYPSSTYSSACYDANK